MGSAASLFSALSEPWRWRRRIAFPPAAMRLLRTLARALLLVAAITAAALLVEGTLFYLSVLVLCVLVFGLQARADLRTMNELHALSLLDPLTSIGNRRALQARLAEEIARCVRGGYSVAVLMIDVDKLKEINDRDGHRAGDDALRAIADAMCRSTRISDVVGRLGGDEFLVIAPQTSAAEAQALAERIIANAGRIPLSYDARRGVGLSIGVAVAASKTADGQALLEQADQAMYSAKIEGGNRVVCCGRDRTKKVVRLRPVSDR